LQEEELQKTYDRDTAGLQKIGANCLLFQDGKGYRKFMQKETHRAYKIMAIIPCFSKGKCEEIMK
jgi:hypothetical protein